MKKLFFVICMMLMSVATFAQQGKMTIGIHGDYMIDSPKNFGFGANIGYEVINNVRGVAEFNYFLKKDHVSFWNVDVNAEYLFRLGDSGFTIYPLAGIALLGSKVDSDYGGASDSKLGLNLGAGVEYQISSNLALKAEYNYKTQWNGSSYLKFGVVIPF
ncbi:MAG: porin family protein [Prevotella sp.]|nr:porin family protein [Prevotella sp.]